MPELPSGTVTFLLSDIAGSTQLWQLDPGLMRQAVNRCARLRAVGHGGQTLLSQSTYDLIRDHLPAGLEVRDLGEHRLRDLIRPERVFQLDIAGVPGEFPPLRSLTTFPNNLPVQ